MILGLILTGCAHTSEGPLDVPLGLPRAQIAGELKRFDYCPREEPESRTQTFPRCDNPGIDYRDSWVVVEYESDRVTRVRRYERWDDDARATERWSQLVSERSKTSGQSDAARAIVSSRHDLPPGTRSWQAFKSGEYTVVAVYLLTPRPPENASILEEILGTDGAATAK